MDIKMKTLYLLSGQCNDYDTFDSCVVCAYSEEEAKLIRPDGESWDDLSNPCYKSWDHSIDDIHVETIGLANANVEIGIVISSFNAG